MKKMRKRFGKMRYFACGEYGEQFSRPHYHILLFGFDFPDKVLRTTRGENKIYESKLLEEVWGKGLTEIGSITFASASYVAQYIMKKQQHKTATGGHYAIRSKDTGAIQSTKEPEFVTMSRRPGIGKPWFDKYKTEVYGEKRNEVIVNGKPMRPPKYYDTQLEKEDPKAHQRMKIQRFQEALKKEADGTTRRLYDREQVEIARQKTLVKRRLENGTESI